MQQQYRAERRLDVAQDMTPPAQVLFPGVLMRQHDGFWRVEWGQAEQTAPAPGDTALDELLFVDIIALRWVSPQRSIAPPLVEEPSRSEEARSVLVIRQFKPY